jgi:hypothetical protein
VPQIKTKFVNFRYEVTEKTLVQYVKVEDDAYFACHQLCAYARSISKLLAGEFHCAQQYRPLCLHWDASSEFAANILRVGFFGVDLLLGHVRGWNSNSDGNLPEK